MINDRIKELIGQIESSPSYRFDSKERRLLADLATDQVKKGDIQILDSLYKKLKIPLDDDNIAHMPIVVPLLERTVGAISSAVDQITAAAVDVDSQLIKLEMKKSKLEELTEQFETDKITEEQLEEALQDIANSEPLLHDERMASTIIKDLRDKLEDRREFDKALYSLLIYGEIAVVTELYLTNKTRTVNTNNLWFIPNGTDPMNIGAASYVMERIWMPVDELIQNPRTPFKIKKLLKDKYKTGLSGGVVMKGVDSEGNIISPSTSVLVDILWKEQSKDTGELETVMSNNEANVEVTILYYPEYKKVKKVYTKKDSLLDEDIDDKDYRLEHKTYTPKSYEKVEEDFIKVPKICYLIEDIDEVILDKELPLAYEEGKYPVTFPSIYSGYIKTISGTKPYSWLHTSKDTIFLRDLIIHNIFHLIRDNAGIITVYEMLGKPSGITFSDWLYQMINHKMLSVDSTKPVASDMGNVPIGNYTKNPVTPLQLDNSANVARLFNMLPILDNLIYTSRGLSSEVMGDIQQNQRASNVRYSVQNTAYIDTPTIDLFYRTFSDAFNSLIKRIELISRYDKLYSEMRESENVEIVNKFRKSSILMVRVTNSYADLLNLQKSKEDAAAAVHQGRLSYKSYIKILDSVSVKEIHNIMEEEEEKASKAQQRQFELQAKMEEQKDLREHNQQKEIHAMDSETKLQIAKLNASRIASTRSEQTKN